MWQPPGACVSGWAAADRRASLPEFCVPVFYGRREAAAGCAGAWDAGRAAGQSGLITAG